MTRTSARIAAVAAALALLATGWWLGQRPIAPIPRAEAPASGTAPTPEAAATAETASPEIVPATPQATAGAGDAKQAPLPDPAAPDLPLPPADTPVAELLDSLLDRARSGDARAACRLASELQRCRNSAQRGPSGADMEARVAGEQDERRRESMIQFMARLEGERERSERLCGGIGEAELDLAFGLQMQAAQAQPHLRTWFAINPALDTRMFVDDLDQWQQYRQVAMPWLESAAAAGDLSAVVALARVHGDARSNSPPVPPFRQIDDARFLTYATLLERYGMSVPPVQRAADEARSRIDADVAAAAERQAETLFRPEAAVREPGDSASALQGSFQRGQEAIDCD
jgi:hypothetical protein